MTIPMRTFTGLLSGLPALRLYPVCLQDSPFARRMEGKVAHVPIEDSYHEAAGRWPDRDGELVIRTIAFGQVLTGPVRSSAKLGRGRPERVLARAPPERAG